MSRRSALQPQHAFAVVAVAFGLAMAVITPPFQSPDEATHLLRAYQLSQGVVVAPRHGCVVPASLGECFTRFDYLEAHPARRTSWAAIRGEFARPLDPGRTQWLPIDNTSVYSPVPYAPAVAATWAARRWGASPVAILYAGRMASAAAYAVVGWLAIVATPVLRWPVALVLGGPLPLFLAGSDSADPMTTAVAVLATGLVLRVAVASRPWAVMALAVAMTAVPLCKGVYVPLVGLVFAVPPSAWGRRRWAAPVLIATSSAAALLVWSHLSRPMEMRERAGDPAVQMRWVAGHPIAYAGVLARTAVRQGPNLVYGSLGSLGWLDTTLNPWAVGGYGLLVVWLAVGDPLPARLRWAAAIACAVSIALVVTSIYAMWDPPGATVVEGVQGRYLLPLSLAALVVVRRPGRVPAAWPAVAMVAMAAYAVVAVVRRYYGVG